ncbi:hypothetical protein MAIT1_04137 [Magnetofaba australis IT-1]|uniref:Uncharacterized protein n=1 Tax=Magnetofaba australis IT-1 TaxID=1434232 RepID=A0A1Y2K4G2_9PROT|nr:hypothetical protein MAIT1_04137 [Magnetofaba australis IT-1]
MMTRDAASGAGLAVISHDSVFSFAAHPSKARQRAQSLERPETVVGPVASGRQLGDFSIFNFRLFGACSMMGSKNSL